MNEMIKLILNTVVSWYRQLPPRAKGGIRIMTTSTVVAILLSAPTPDPIRLGVFVGLVITALWSLLTEK